MKMKNVKMTMLEVVNEISRLSEELDKILDGKKFINPKRREEEIDLIETKVHSLKHVLENNNAKNAFDVYVQSVNEWESIVKMQDRLPKTTYEEIVDGIESRYRSAKAILESKSDIVIIRY